MSWNITHQCRFESRTHQQYCVNISKQTDTGQNIKQLQGSEHPFVTSEANGDDIFMPMRQQTGYLRVLDKSGGTLLEELIPENNTQKMVTLINLTTGKTEWIGFLAAEVFTQPWGNDLTELEFPLKSALAALEDVTIQQGMSGTNRLAMLIYSAFTSLFGNDSVPFTDIVLMNDHANVFDCLLIRANFDKFFRKNTVINDNTEAVVRTGATFKSAITALCAVFGLTLRQQGTTLMFGQYGGGQVNTTVIEWGVLAAIQNSTSWPDVPSQGQIVTKDLLPLADFMGSNNNLSFVPGGRNAIVTLNVSDSQDSSIVEMPQSEVKEGGVLVGYAGDNGDIIVYPYLNVNDFYINIDESIRLNFQPSARTGGTETYSYYKANVTVGGYGGVVIDNRYRMQLPRTNQRNWQAVTSAYVIDKSLFGGWNLTFNSHEIVTGAFPGRYGVNNEILQNSLLLVQEVISWADAATPAQACYSISSEDGVNLRNCYINIDFDIIETIYSAIQYIINGGKPGETTKYLPVNSFTVYVKDSFNLIGNNRYSMVCRLRFISGGITYYWWETGWSTDYGTFPIIINNNSIVSNFSPASMPINNNGGYYVYPLDATGKIVFEILNEVRSSAFVNVRDDSTSLNVEVPAYPFHKIISGLTIGLVYPRDVTVTTRGSNVYRKTIIGMGFSEDKHINLELGTNNNNNPSYSLLRTYNNDGYVENIDYTASDGSTISERPEMHLLNRMVEYYKTMRRTMEAKIATGIDLFRNRFSYNGRKYMAIDKKHDWEREEQEVKFIEVT